MNDKLFKFDNSIGSYEDVLPFKLLREHARAKGYDMKTIDMSSNPEKAFAVIFFDVPSSSDKYYGFCIRNKMQDRMYVYAAEPPATYPSNYDKSKHGDFGGILTFSDELVDNKKYFRFDYTLPIRYGKRIVIPKKPPFDSKKLLCLVSSNKFSSQRNELYSERIKAIRFMERNHVRDFDLYGLDWDKPVIHNRWASAIKLSGAILVFWPDSIKSRSFISYTGKTVDDKRKVLPKYKFTIAYENCITPGYISEKILEAMFSGCVPIYLGDPHVERRVPRNCFVDKRRYPTYESLYEYISEMEKGEHEKYLKNIEKFLNSKSIYPFTVDAFIGSFERMLGI